LIYLIGVAVLFMLVFVLIIDTQKERNKIRPIKKTNRKRQPFFSSKLPKYHNSTTTILRLLVVLLSFTVVAIPYSVLYVDYGFSGVVLTIALIWPWWYLTLNIVRKIKIGKLHTERNKMIKNFIKDVSMKNDYINELERLSSLKDKGIITEDEFQTKKKELLGRI